MNKRTKVAIFLVAVIVTLVGFNLVASPSAVDLLSLNKAPGYYISVTVSAQPGPITPPAVHSAA